MKIDIRGRYTSGDEFHFLTHSMADARSLVQNLTNEGCEWIRAWVDGAEVNHSTIGEDDAASTPSA